MTKTTFDEFFAHFSKHPGMFAGRDTFEYVSTFLVGVDFAYGLTGAKDTCLRGFQEWMNLKLRRRHNSHWSALFAPNDEEGRERLFQAVREFRAEPHEVGLEAILAKHAKRFSASGPAKTKSGSESPSKKKAVRGKSSSPRTRRST